MIKFMGGGISHLITSYCRVSYYAGITSDCWTPLVGTSDMLTTMRRTGELCTRPMVSSLLLSCRAEQVSFNTAITITVSSHAREV